MVAFSRDTLSARCLEVCLDLMIKCSGTNAAAFFDGELKRFLKLRSQLGLE